MKTLPSLVIAAGTLGDYIGVATTGSVTITSSSVIDTSKVSALIIRSP